MEISCSDNAIASHPGHFVKWPAAHPRPPPSLMYSPALLVKYNRNTSMHFCSKQDLHQTHIFLHSNLRLPFLYTYKIFQQKFADFSVLNSINNTKIKQLFYMSRGRVMASRMRQTNIRHVKTVARAGAGSRCGRYCSRPHRLVGFHL